MNAVVHGAQSVNHKWARWYVEAHGLAVFPLPAHSKKPGTLGITAATTNLAQIDAWWYAQPDANIGVTGCLRVDVDTKHDGMQAWSALVAKHGAIKTLTARTPSGGLHLYLLTNKPLGNGTGTLPAGIDIRGDSTGYTVAPPSVTIAAPGESAAGHYEFIDAQAPIMQAPQWLLEIIGTERHSEQPVEAITTIDDAQTAELWDALIHPAMLSDWARWSDNGLALRSLGDAGYALWVEYSQRQLEACPDHATGTDTADTWWSRHRATGIKSDYRSIFTRAQALGWKNPRAVDPSTLGFGQQPLPVLASGAPMTKPAPVVASQAKRFQSVGDDAFLNGTEPEWRIEDVLPASGLAMIYGQSGSGKSFFALDLAMSITRGIHYGIDHHSVRQGRVVYVAAEAAGGFKKRLRAYYHHHSLKTGLPIRLISDAPNLMNATDSSELCASITEMGGADVVFVDTLHASMSGGEENSANDMGVVLGHCKAIQRATGGLVVLIHHSGKDENKGARGSSSIRAAMDCELEVTRDGDQRAARITKQKEGEDGMVAAHFELIPVVIFGERPCTSAVVKHVEKPRARGQQRVRISPEQEAIIDQVRNYQDGVAMEVLLAAVVAAREAKGDDVKAKVVRQSVRRLIEHGFVSCDGGLIRLASGV